MASTKRLPTRRLGANDPEVSTIGLGTMGSGAFYGKTDENAAYKALTYSADRETGHRSEIFVATKFGSQDPEGKFGGGASISTPSYIKYALERSLGVDYIDLYYQHRVDPEVPIEVVMETLRGSLENSTIRWIGLSECSIDMLRRAKAVKGVGEKIIAAHMEFSSFSLDIEKDGFTAAAMELGVTVVAYSPLGRGMVTGKYRSRSDFGEGDVRSFLPRFSEENFPKNLTLVDKIQSIANKYNVTPTQVTLTRILATSENYIPISERRSVERVEENAKGAEIQLSKEDVDAIKKLSEAADVQGLRYPSSVMQQVEGDCIPLEQWKGEQ